MCSMNNPSSFQELETLFRQRVNSDKKEFGTDSEYLPNPAICLTPDFCLIAMEPSVKTGLEDVRKDIKLGYRNFLHSEEDFVLHYCAYSYLCKNDFRYYITDVSKGAMTTKDARQFRECRYREWLPLLKHELRLLGNPSTIAIGLVLKRHLSELLLEPNFAILHYSWSNSRWIQERYLKIKRESPLSDFDGIEPNLLDFADHLMQSIGYTKEMRGKRLIRLFQRTLPKWKKALLAVYKFEFQRIRSD
jgi:hypothetical protein